MSDAWEGEAPAKTILTGEHAVVYGHRAVCLPVNAFRASVRVTAREGTDVSVEAPDLGLSTSWPNPHPPPWLAPLGVLLEEGARAFPRPAEGMEVKLTSTIPVGRGLGSSAAVAVALLRALAGRAGRTLSPEEVSALALKSEQLLHGTPSGVDTTTVAYGKPVRFQTGGEFQVLKPGPVTFVLADSGPGPGTRDMVNQVRRAVESPSSNARALLEAMGGLATEVVEALQRGNGPLLGSLLTRNHELLRDLGVSTPRLDGLCEIAVSTGAWGAKLTGAGGGGFIIAVTAGGKSDAVADALRASGADNVTVTRVGSKRR